VGQITIIGPGAGPQLAGQGVPSGIIRVAQRQHWSRKLTHAAAAAQIVPVCITGGGFDTIPGADQNGYRTSVISPLVTIRDRDGRRRGGP